MKVTILPANFAGEPEVVAMLQAFYSRSTEPIADRLARLGSNVDSVKTALNRYYVGYGHKSIGDCGTATLFIEGVSILAAKAVQDDPRYNGQECSTRYINISDAVPEFEYPSSKEWRELYLKASSIVLASVRKMHPRLEGESEAIHANATMAYAFDITRGLLPASTLTNLSITASLRVLREVSVALRGSPLPEVRSLGDLMNTELVTAYPASFPVESERDQTEINWRRSNHNLYYRKYDAVIAARHNLPNFSSMVTVCRKPAPSTLALFNSRPPGIVPSEAFESKMVVTLSGVIDYGSWRDLQRHRRCKGVPPLLTADYGMHPWYLEQLEIHAPGIAAEASELIDSTLDLQADEVVKSTLFQYCIPLGAVVPFTLDMSLSQAVYLAELRSSPTVHPTLRPIAQYLGNKLQDLGINVNVNTDEPIFLKRGKQTIMEKP